MTAHEVLAIDQLTIDDKRTIGHVMSVAITANNIPLVRQLLSSGCSANFTKVDGDSILIHAIEDASIDICRLLLVAGADVNLANLNGQTPIILALQCSLPTIVLELVQNGAAVDKVDFSGMNCFHAAITGRLISFCGILSEMGAPINGSNIAGLTPLGMACLQVDVHAVDTLLSCGAQPDLLDDGGQTALHRAASATTDSLIEAHRSNIIYEETELKSVNSERKLNVRENNVKIVRLLHLYGASVNVRNITGQTPLHVATTCNNCSVALELLQLGADIDARESSDSGDGWTALHISVWHGHYEMIQLLLQKGANTELTDFENRTPKMLAQQFGAVSLEEWINICKYDILFYD